MKMAPTFATLPWTYLVENLPEKIGQKHGNNTNMNFIRSWKRYNDNCFIFWKGSWGNINDIHNRLQTLHPMIKLTTEENLKEQTFLDILIKNQIDQIFLDICHKSTDNQWYLHFKSYHSKSCINSIPSYFLVCRIYTLGTNQNFWLVSPEEERVTLHQREYPTTLIRKGFELTEKNTIT